MSQRTTLVPLWKHTYLRHSRNQLARASRWINLQIPFQITLSVLLEVIHELQKMLNTQKVTITSTTFSTVITWEKGDL